MKKLWLIWARTVDHRVGKTDDDEPDIPILTQKQARVSLMLRTFIILLNIEAKFSEFVLNLKIMLIF